MIDAIVHKAAIAILHARYCLGLSPLLAYNEIGRLNALNDNKRLEVLQCAQRLCLLKESEVNAPTKRRCREKSPISISYSK